MREGDTQSWEAGSECVGLWAVLSPGTANHKILKVSISL